MKRAFLIVAIGFMVYFVVGTILFLALPDRFVLGIAYTDGIGIARADYVFTTLGDIFSPVVHFWLPLQEDGVAWIVFCLMVTGVALGLFFGLRYRRRAKSVGDPT